VLPPDVLRVERRRGSQLWVERADREGRPDQRWSVVRGPRFDAVLEQVGVPVDSALAAPELVEAVRALDIGINRHLGEAPAAGARLGPHARRELRPPAAGRRGRAARAGGRSGGRALALAAQPAGRTAAQSAGGGDGYSTRFPNIGESGLVIDDWGG
jgi:hypothetical protein